MCFLAHLVDSWLGFLVFIYATQVQFLDKKLSSFFKTAHCCPSENTLICGAGSDYLLEPGSQSLRAWGGHEDNKESEFLGKYLLEEESEENEAGEPWKGVISMVALGHHKGTRDLFSDPYNLKESPHPNLFCSFLF